MRHGGAGLAAAIALLAAPAAGAQSPPPAVPAVAALRLSGPSVRAAGIAIPLTGRGAPAAAVVELQRLVDGQR